MESTLNSLNAKNLKDRIMNNILRINEDDDPHHEQDICRVCRLSGEDTLYHPCLCTGSIKYVHQDCLVQWLKYSNKEVCELCNHKFSFRNVYREDMPERLPIYDFLKGLFSMAKRFIGYFLWCCMLTTCWLGFLPLLASRVYRIVMSGVISSIFSLKIFSLFSPTDASADILRGAVILSFNAAVFFLLAWLREQINSGASQDFLHLPEPEPSTNVQIRETPNPQDNERHENHADADETQQNATDDNTVALVGENNQNNINNDNNANNNEDLERLVEDFSWQQVVGLDGTWAFMEVMVHAALVNIFFDVVLLYCPAQIGVYLLQLLGYSGRIFYFELLVHVFTGYGVVFVSSYLFHELARTFQWKLMYTFSAMVYLMLKALFLFVVEIVIFPTICGWWLDICSLPLTGASLDARLKTFGAYPFSSMFLHWLVGMIYVFYSASFILVLRELLRPGVLWFIRNLNDPEFNPVLEMIQQSFVRHCRRLVASTTLFFTIILLVVYIPLRLIRWVSPHTLPYVFTATADTPMGELSLELILLQIVMPTVLEYSKAFSILKKVVQLWCRVFGGWLKLDSYLLPRSVAQNDENEQGRPRQREDAAERAARAAAAFAAAARGARTAQFENRILNGDDSLAGGRSRTDSINLKQRNKKFAGNGDEVPHINNPHPNDDEGFGAEEDNDVLMDTQGGQGSSLSSAKPNISNNTDSDLLLSNATPSTSFGITREQPDEREAEAVMSAKLFHQQLEANPHQNDYEHQLQANEEQIQHRVVEQLDAVAVAQRNEHNNHREENHLAARHQALLMIRENADFEDYERPDMFVLRIVALLMCLAGTAIAISFLFFLIPVSMGRVLFKLISRMDGGNGLGSNWLGKLGGIDRQQPNSSQQQPIHDLYTLAAGLYFCWLMSKLWMVAYEWCQKGWDYVCKVFRSTAWLALRLIAAVIPLFIIIPFMLGLLFQLLVVGPLRVSINQTPLFFPWKEWAIGVLHFKIFCASVLMGPDWWLKAVFEQIYAAGIRNFELKYLYLNLVLPLLNFISLQISLPYVAAKIIFFFFDLSNEEKVVYTRYTYPFMLLCIGALAFLFWQWQKLKGLAQTIRNDKYLIGTQLVNFYRESSAAVSAAAGAKNVTTTVQKT